jgi:fumarate reductase subunit C
VNSRREAWLWMIQRASAAVLALCVLAHLATMIFAVRGGLTAAEILGRTRGSIAWAAFYGTFVIAVALHAPIGLRAMFGEWFGWHGRSMEMAMILFAALLGALGFRAILGVVS